MVLQLIPLHSVADCRAFQRQSFMYSFLLFHGPTCKPCQRLKLPLFMELAQHPTHTIVIGTIDAQAYPALRAAFGSPKLPTILRTDEMAQLQSSDMATVRDFLARELKLKLPTTLFNPTVDF